MSKQVHLYQMSEAMEIVLSQGGEVSFVTSGFSMLPLLRNHMDTAFLKKPTKPVRKGDVIFYRRDDGKFVLHRIIGKNADGFILRGDNQKQIEYGVREDMILAVLVRVKRKEGKVIECSGTPYKLYTKFLPFVRLFRLHIYPQYVRFLAPLVRKIKKYK